MQHDNFGNAPHLLAEDDARKIENNEYRRASGEVICEFCGKPYWKHPLVLGALWLNKVCGDDLVHL